MDYVEDGGSVNQTQHLQENFHMLDFLESDGFLQHQTMQRIVVELKGGRVKRLSSV